MEHTTCLSPHNGQPLERIDEYLLSDGELLWPRFDGITYLRPRHDLRQAAVGAIREGRPEEGLLILLADQDRFSPTPPPPHFDLEQLVNDHSLTLRDAMALLNYGPVGDYFSYRWCSPTFVSGLRLLELSVKRERPVVEVACGIGHFLRPLEAQGIRTVGIDIVFSKLWLARRFLGVRGPLLCGDIEASPLLSEKLDRTVFCHDAFYFFEHKQAALQHMRSVAGQNGTVAIGHVHTRQDAHEAGFAATYDTYRALAGGSLWTDASLATNWYDRAKNLSPADPLSVAVSWWEGSGGDDAISFAESHAELSLNPLLRSQEPAWPSEGWRREYLDDCLSLRDNRLAEVAKLPAAQALRNAKTTVSELPPEVRRELYRRRVLVDLPEVW